MQPYELTYPNGDEVREIKKMNQMTNFLNRSFGKSILGEVNGF